jgi:uncharacterized protein
MTAVASQPAASGRRRPRRRRLLAVVVAVLMGALAVGYMYGSSMVYDAISVVPPDCGGRFVGNTPASFRVDGLADVSRYQMADYQAVSFPSRDPGITIRAWYIPSATGPAGPAVVLVHGHGSCKREDRMLLAAGMLHRAGIGALLIDLRNHGDSTVVNGRYAGGTREYRDALGGWDWLVDQGYAPGRVGMYGQSLGAATALIATGEEPRVAAVWEDSSYADFDVAIQAEMTRDGYPTILRYGGYLMAYLRSGDDLLAVSPIGAVAKLHGRPIFITHGGADTRLSTSYAADLAAAVRANGGTVDPWIIPGATHTQGIVLEPAEYERRLDAFFGRALAETSS